MESRTPSGSVKFRAVVFQIIPWEERRKFFGLAFQSKEGEWDMVFLGRIGDRHMKPREVIRRDSEHPGVVGWFYFLYHLFKGKPVRVEDFPFVYNGLPLWVKRPHEPFKEGQIVEIDLTIRVCAWPLNLSD